MASTALAGLPNGQGIAAGRARIMWSRKTRLALGWEPRISLEEGRARTYAWVHGELGKSGRSGPPALGAWTSG
jgi:nucleoside-diphosphate-sugar epimerase